MSAGKNVLKPLPMLIVDAFTLNDLTWTEVTSGGIAEAVKMVHFFSYATNVFVSYDGVTAHDIIRGSTSMPYFSPQMAATPAGYVSLFAKGTKIYLKLTDAAPGVNNIYIAMYY